MTVIRTRKLSDKALVELIKKLMGMLPDAQVRGRYAGGVVFSATDPSELADLPQKNNERLIDSFSVTRAQGTSDQIDFARGIESTTQPNNSSAAFHKFRHRQTDPYFDEVAIFENPNRQSIQNYVSFDDDQRVAISRELGKLAAPISTVDSSEAASFGQMLDQNIADLQRLSMEFVERAAEARSADEAALRDRSAQLDSIHAQRLDELAQKQKQLDNLREEINDREPQHERRRLRESLTKEITEYIKSPDQGAANREIYANLTYLVVGAVFVLFSVILTLGNDAQASDPATWARLAKSVLAAGAGAAFVWAGLAGLKSAAKAGREFEQRVRLYGFDMDRASWIVETILQMSASEAKQIPDEWLRSACRHLFEETSTGRNETKSLDSFAALFDATARAKIGTSGIDFEIDRKGAKRLAAEA